MLEQAQTHVPSPIGARASMRQSLALTLLAVAAVSACSGDRTPASDTTRAGAGQSAAAPPAGAAVTITSPAEGATTGSDVTVTLHAQGVRIAKADGAKAEGVGHYH